MINLFGDCQGDLKGSGIDPCSIDTFGDFKGYGLLRPGTKITQVNFDDQSYWETLLKDGKYFPYLNSWTFENTTGENEVATNSRGINKNIRDAKASYSVTFAGTPCLIKSLQDKKDLSWDIILFYTKCIVVLKNTDDTLGGFYAPYFNVGTWASQSGTDIQSVPTMFQIEDSEDFNKNFEAIMYSEMSFRLDKLKGAFESVLKATAAAGTSISVTVNASCNSSVGYIGLEQASNWAVNGVAPSAVSSAGNVYTLTVPTMTAGQAQTIILKGEDANGNIYKGKTTITVSS